MAFQKKVIILSDTTSQSGTGIVKITENGDDTIAKINIYNNYDNLTMLLSVGKKIKTFKVDKINEISLGNIKLDDTIDCLIINENNKAVLYGSTGGNKFRCFNLLEEYRRQNQPITNIDNKNIINDIKPLENVEKNQTPISNKGKKEDKFSNYLNKKAVLKSNFVEKNLNNKNILNEKENVEKCEETEPESDTQNNDGIKIKSSHPILNEGVQYIGENFYMAVKPQLDEMFICYPIDQQLNDIVPNSKWVRVAIEDDYYVVGIILDLDEPKYICYGIHGYFNQKPPEEISNICEWLPINLNKPEKEGYWLIYQSASNGKTLKKEN